MAGEFKAGDIVQLKSGGPPMTVEEDDRRGRYRCVWFKGASMEGGYFQEQSLKLYEPPKT